MKGFYKHLDKKQIAKQRKQITRTNTRAELIKTEQNQQSQIVKNKTQNRTNIATLATFLARNKTALDIIKIPV